jgi:PBP1b-binding outer membrane lipoprotein LpoB
MRRRTGERTLAVVLMVGCAVASGCAPPSTRTSFLNSVDLVDMTEQMSRSFARSPAIADRGPRTMPRWIISMSPVVNKTNQIISENQKWLYLGRLRMALTQSRLSDQHNLAWIVPPEHWAYIAKELGFYGEPPELRTPPTHLLTAEFSALTNTSGQGRSDAYLCSYQLVDLATGGMVWEDAWEVKRAVIGTTYD